MICSWPINISWGKPKPQRTRFLNELLIHNLYNLLSDFCLIGSFLKLFLVSLVPWQHPKTSHRRRRRQPKMEYKNPYLPEPPPRYEDDRTTHFMAVSTVVPTPIGKWPTQPLASFGTFPLTLMSVYKAVVPNALAVGPSMASCPSCQSRQLTTVHHEPNTNTHLLALLLCVIG